MRIVHILNRVTDKGDGMVNAALDLVAGQIRCGHQVAVISAGGGHEALLERIGVQHRKVAISTRPANLLQAVRGVGRHLGELRPDVIHAHMCAGLLLALPWARLHRVPTVGHLHNVHERKSLLFGLANRVIAVSASVGESFAKRGIPKKRIRVVLNGPLGSPRLPPLAMLPKVELSKPAVVTVCGMNRRKGIADLLKAFDQVAAQSPLPHLYLVGDGPDMGMFKAQAAESRSSERIHFEGFQQFPQSYMRAADVFILASHRDSFGLVLTEAREAGCAIAASNVDGIPEALDGGAAGLLFTPGNVDEIAKCMLLLTTNLGERQMWQGRAQQGLDRFRIEHYAREVDAVYAELLRKRQIAEQIKPSSV